jgi:hypothetical protein
VILRPFFRYYGGKWRAVHRGLYPQPLHRRICEPFAGSAGYALHYATHDVTLVDRDPVICGIWRFLIAATRDDVLDIPLVDSVDDLPEWVPQGARDLIGFSMNAATSSPRRSLSAGARKLRDSGRKLYGWSETLRARVAEQVPHIKHWRIHEGDYTLVDRERHTTWFVDPPYADAGQHYRHHDINYDALGVWCRERHGQIIVCEQAGADWLPFRDVGAMKAGPGKSASREAVWP